MRIVAAAIVLVVAGSATAQPFDMTVNQAQSSVSVELCIAIGCDSDTSAVSGGFNVELDSPTAPTQITMHDFDLAVTEQIDLSISVIFLGGITATGNGITVAYAEPGTPLGPAALTGGAFEFTNVPVVAGGTISYNATGLVCTALGNAGLPCNGTIDLADQGVLIANSIGGTVTVSGGVATLNGMVSLTAPIDPENPDLGSLTIEGTLVATGTPPETPPCAGDYNGDGARDTSDFFEFFGDFFATPPDADYNDDGSTDTADFFEFFSDFFGPPCG